MLFKMNNEQTNLAPSLFSWNITETSGYFMDTKNFAAELILNVTTKNE